MVFGLFFLSFEFFWVIHIVCEFILNTWFGVFGHVSKDISSKFEEEHKVDVSVNFVQDILVNNANEPHSVLDQVLN